MTYSMGPGKLVRHIKNLSYTYNEYLICIGLGPSISSVICKNLSYCSYSGPSYPSSPVYIYIYIYIYIYVYNFKYYDTILSQYGTFPHCLSLLQRAECMML